MCVRVSFDGRTDSPDRRGRRDGREGGLVGRQGLSDETGLVRYVALPSLKGGDRWIDKISLSYIEYMRHRSE